MSEYSVPITLADGKPRSLRYDWNALEALEDAGIPLASLEAVMADSNRTMRTMRIIIWAGLLHEDASLTAKDVGALMLPISAMDAWAKCITAAFTAAFGKAEAGDRKNAAAPGTGETTPGTGDSN